MAISGSGIPGPAGDLTAQAQALRDEAVDAANTATAAAAETVTINDALKLIVDVTIGKAGTPLSEGESGGSSVGNGSVIFATQAPSGSGGILLQEVRFFPSANGTLKIEQWGANGREITFYTKTVTANGSVQTVTPADFGTVTLPEGKYIALHGSLTGVLSSNALIAADGLGYWYTTNMSATIASLGSPSTDFQRQAGLDFTYLTQNITGQSFQDEVDARKGLIDTASDSGPELVIQDSIGMWPITLTSQGAKVHGRPIEPVVFDSDARPIYTDPYCLVGPVIDQTQNDPAYAGRKATACPAMAVVGDRTFVVYFGHNDTGAATSAEVNGTFLTVCISDDNLTWRRACRVMPNPSVYRSRCSDTTLLVVGERLFVRCLHHVGDHGGNLTGYGAYDGYDCTWGFWIYNPLADPGTWITSAPVWCGIGFSYNACEIDGKTYVATSYGPVADTPYLAGEWGRFLELWEPATSSFSKAYSIPITEPSGVGADPDYRTFWEGQVRQRRDRTLHCLYRTTQGLYQQSYDGTAWDTASPWTVPGATPSSKCAYGNTPQGYAYWVGNASASRDTMTVMLSPDDGVTWPLASRLLLYAPSSSYPVVSFDRAGNLLAAYDATRTTASTRILQSKVSVRALLAGTATTPTPTVVDQYS